MKIDKRLKQFCPRGHDTHVVGRSKYGGGCKACLRISERSRDKIRDWKDRGIINIDGSQFKLVNYDRLYKIQKGKCEICGIHSSKLDRSLGVDHDHKTGIVRGLLCNHCNLAIGFFQDNTDIILKAYDYLT